VLPFFYVLFFYFYLFFGAAPTATINGTAVSLMPELSVAGSGLQFAIQNVGKLVIPALGGVVLEIMNDTVRYFGITRIQEKCKQKLHLMLLFC